MNGMTAEINTIAQSTQAYDAHQRQFTTELSLCTNQIQDQLNALFQLVTNMDARMDAQ